MAAISYNLYLYHQLVARELFQHAHSGVYGRSALRPQWQTRYTEAAFAMTIAQAAIVTYCFERPLLATEATRSGRC